MTNFKTIHPTRFRWCTTLASVLLTLMSTLILAEHNQSVTDTRTSSHLAGSTTNIPVNIQVKPAIYLHGKIYISTGVSLTAKAEILDDRFKNATIEYQWSVRNKTITTKSNASEIEYKFEAPDPNNFLEVLVFHHPNDTGVSRKEFVIRDPVVIAEPEGKLFLEHGQLLDIKIKFKGTGPFKYCRQFCLIENHEPDYCKECQPDISTDANEVDIIKYLHSVGNYTLLFTVDNIASREVKNYLVRITDTVRPKTIPYIPIVSSILAVIILLSGVALHLKFKKTIVTETADFDFIRHDYNNDEEFWEEEQSFLQRVRYLLFRADIEQENSMSDSNMSGMGACFH